MCAWEMNEVELLTMLLPDLIPTADCDRGKEDVTEKAGTSREGGDSAAVHVVFGVGDKEVESQTDASNDDQTPDGTLLIPERV